MSLYDQQIHDAMMRCGCGPLSPPIPAARIAAELGRGNGGRGMDASLRAATARVDWLVKTDGGWTFTDAEFRRIGCEQEREELEAERLLAEGVEG